MVKYSPFIPARDFNSSFLSCEKDLEAILKKLFITSRPYSDLLKRLLVINNKDCLDTGNAAYADIIASTDLADLIEQGYIKTAPRLEFGEHEEIKSYIIIEFNNFMPNSNNPQFRDSVIDFNIICNTDSWDLGDFQIRPIKIMGYIDGLLNGAKLTGIGTLEFMGANEVVLDQNISGYLLRYAAIHGSDDKIEEEE